MASKEKVGGSPKISGTKLHRNLVNKKRTISNGIQTYAIRLKRGAKIVQSLEEFSRKYENEIGFAEFSMIGSVEKVKIVFSLGYGKGEEGYHPVSLPLSDKAKTVVKTSLGQMELLPSWGNITWKFGNSSEPIVHCHVNLANYEYLQAFGGHLKEATVALTAEIVLKVLSKEKVFKKKDNKDTKAHLWNFDRVRNQIVIDNKKMLVTRFNSSLKEKQIK